MSERRRPHMGGAHMSGEKAKDFKGTFKKLLSYLGRYKIAILLVMIFAALSAVFNILGPRVMGNITTEIYNGLVAKISGTGGIDFIAIGNIILILLALYVASALFSFIQGFIMSGVSNKISYKFRDDLSKKINRLPMKYFDKTSHGDILSRVTNDVDTLSQSLNQSLAQIISSVMMLIGVLIMMFTISWLMTLVVLLLLPISLALTSVVMKRSQKYFSGQQKYLGEANGQVEEIFGGQNIVKAFNAEEKVCETFQKTNDKLYESAWKSQFFSGLMQPIMQFVGNLGYVAVTILGGVLAANGTIQVGEIQSIIQYVRNFTQPLTQIAQMTNMLQSTMAAAERVFEFLEEEEEPPAVANPEHVDGLEGNVTFDHVSFGYNPDKIIIHDFSTEIKQGQKVAIVGPTGAGKTTMVKLLMRFYDVNSGAIKIDGKDIRDFDRNELRSMFGMVLQDTWLFSGTIRENLRYGKLNATDEEVVAAAKAAHADRFIRTHAEGYDLVLNEETSNISAGQKQLLTIARAFLADPKILILDEDTNSVDTRTEAQIVKAMEALMQGRTSFVIAHRLSTIRDADLILVMKDGDIVEQGNHQELLAKNGMYAELYNSQF